MSLLDRDQRSRRYSQGKQDRFQKRDDSRRKKKGMCPQQLDDLDQEDLIFNKGKKSEIDKEFTEMVEYIGKLKTFPPNIRRKYYPFNHIIKLLEEDPDGPYHISDFYGGC